jgi:hypothetical protein
MTIHDAIAADVAARVAAGNAVAAHLFTLSDADLETLMIKVTDGQVKAIKDLLMDMNGPSSWHSPSSLITNPERFSAKVPHVRTILVKMHSPAFERRSETMLKRIAFLAQSRARAIRSVGWWSLSERARVAMYGHLIWVILPDAFSPTQLSKLHDPFAMALLGERNIP